MKLLCPSALLDGIACQIPGNRTFIVNVEYFHGHTVDKKNKWSNFEEYCIWILVEGYTLTETNITPETRPSQKEIHLPIIHFQGRFVSFRKGRCVFLLAAIPPFRHIYRHFCKKKLRPVPNLPWRKFRDV